jgi:hypothetical protein
MNNRKFYPAVKSSGAEHDRGTLVFVAQGQAGSRAEVVAA